MHITSVDKGQNNRKGRNLARKTTNKLLYKISMGGCTVGRTTNLYFMFHKVILLYLLLVRFFLASINVVLFSVSSCVIFKGYSRHNRAAFSYGYLLPARITVINSATFLCPDM